MEYGGAYEILSSFFIIHCTVRIWCTSKHKTTQIMSAIVAPLTLKFDRATRPFLKFDRRHWTLLKLTERNKK